MKRKMTLSLSLTLSLLLSLASVPSTAQAAPPRSTFDSGFIPLGVAQTLRITVAGNAGNDALRVRLKSMRYMAQACSGMPQLCRYTIVNQTTTPPETLSPDDALSFEVQGTGGVGGVRVVVESSSPTAPRATAVG